MSQKKNPQRKAIRKKVEMNLVVDKLYDLTCMEFQREEEEATSTQSVSPGNNNNIDKQTETTKENLVDSP